MPAGLGAAALLAELYKVLDRWVASAKRVVQCYIEVVLEFVAALLDELAILVGALPKGPEVGLRKLSHCTLTHPMLTFDSANCL
jgi:hypothetical protein